MTSPGRIRLPSIILARSTTPTMQPARSYSPLRYIPGICAVSPPIKAQPAGATCFREAGENLIEHARLQFFRADVVEKEQWPRAEHRDVVDAMVNQIRADGVMPVHREGDLQFGADAIDARDQDRLAHSGKVRREQAAEAADFPEHFRAVRALHARLDFALNQVAEIDVDPGARVAFFFIGARFHLRGPRTSSDALPRSARAFERPSRFSMMNLSSSGSTGSG